MPRKQKYARVEKEYGVNKSDFYKKPPEFVQNQIVQINMNSDDIKEKDNDDLLDYNPELTEPKGLVADGLEEYERIQYKDEITDESKKIQSLKQKMDERNKEIELDLEKRAQKYSLQENETMLSWIDLQSSQGFEQNLRRWPNVNLPCFWCLESFHTMPWPLVVGRSKDGTFKVRGHHCSPNCALANGLDSREISENISMADMYSWNQAFIYKVTGDYDVIRPSPPRMMLKKFGGWMTIDVFRKECGITQFSSYLTYPPLETSLPVWNRIKTQEDADVHSDDKELVLKRSKPFYDPKQSLDSLWQIR